MPAPNKPAYDRHKWTKENTRNVAVHLSNDKYDKFSAICAQEGVTRSGLINQWIDAYIADHTPVC